MLRAVAFFVLSEKFERLPRWALYARLPLQLLFAWHIWRGTGDSEK